MAFMQKCIGDRRMRVNAERPGAAAPLGLGRRSGGCGVHTRRREQGHGGVDSGGRAAFQHAGLSEEGEGAAAKVSVAFDLSGEWRSGEGAHRRRRRRRCRAGERKGKGRCGDFLQ